MVWGRGGLERGGRGVKECGMEVRYVTPNLPAIGSAIESQTAQLTSLNQQ
jgi:hypothetical protein